MLLDVRDEETGDGLSDRELRDQVVTFLVAGSETTAIGLTWAFYLLSRHPEAWERVRGEVESVIAMEIRPTGRPGVIRQTSLDY
jgi:cytochrome P450